MKIIEPEWKSYERDVLTTTASDVQRSECRLAFYAGAAAVFGRLIDSVGDDDEEPTSEEVNVVKAIHDELLALMDERRKWLT